MTRNELRKFFKYSVAMAGVRALTNMSGNTSEWLLFESCCEKYDLVDQYGIKPGIKVGTVARLMLSEQLMKVISCELPMDDCESSDFNQV